MITFKPAVREHTPLVIGIAGPSGSGKSLSALRMGTGMAGGAPVFLINTEGARGHLYADEFPVPTYDLEEPFSMDRYREAIDEAVKQKPGVLIIDSGSHAHEGVGGMLDQHEAELDRRAGQDYAKRERMTWAAWVKPKAAEAQMINAMLRANCHIILCLRAKEKLKIVKGKDPEPLGWQPICSDRMTFETTITFILPPGSEGRPDAKELGAKHRKPLLPILNEVKQIDEQLGKRLAEWAAGKTKGGEPHREVLQTSTTDLTEGGATINYDAALRRCKTNVELKQTYEAIPWGDLGDDDTARLTKLARELKANLRAVA